MPKRILASRASAFLLLALAAIAHGRAQQTTSNPVAPACVADPLLPAFEVAAITPVAEKDRVATTIGEYGLPHFTLRSVSLSFLLGFSFDVRPANFINAPRNLDETFFDVQVESTDGKPLTYSELKPRMQQLLEQRFCLKAHMGTKLVTGYALVSTRDGVKIKQANASDARGAAYITPNEVVGTNIDMKAFASLLTSPAGRPVQDKTGLQGKYTITINYASPAEVDATGPSIFTAIKEQLGLELKPAQVPIQILVIEHLNLTPTAN